MLLQKIKPYLLHARFGMYKMLIALKKYPLSKSLIICSEARGGSTWLMELLADVIDKSVTNWEPLHVNKGVVPKAFNWGWRPHIKQGNSEREYQQWVEKVLTCQITSHWTVAHNRSILKVLQSEWVITKFVRANLLLPWLTSTFQLNQAPIYLLRHPIAVALSQIKNFHTTEPLGEYTVPDCINNEKYHYYKDYLNSLTSRLERQVALWCLHNIPTIKHPNQGKWLVIYYEYLVLKPKETVAQITEKWHLKANLSQLNAEKPSSADFLKSYQTSKQAQLSKWQKQVSADELERIQQIFDKFELTIYNTSSILPISTPFL